jgi:hypothetical protein
MENYSNGEISVGMYKLKEAIEKFYSDLLISHRRKCDYVLAGVTICSCGGARKWLVPVNAATIVMLLESWAPRLRETGTIIDEFVIKKD